MLTTKKETVLKRAVNFVRVAPLVLLVVAILFTLFSDERIVPTKARAVRVSAPAEDQPAPSLAPISAVRLPFTTFDIDNTLAHTVTIESVRVEAQTQDIGIVSGVALMGESGEKIGSTKTLDAKGQALLEASIELKPSESRRLTIAADIAPCPSPCATAGTVVTINVIDIIGTERVAGTLPIAGAGHTYNATLKLGHASIETNGQQNQPSFIRGTNATFSDLLLTNDGNEDVQLRSIRYAYTGTLPYNDIRNMQLRVGDVSLNPIWSTDGQYVTATFSSPMPLSQGQSVRIHLAGDIDLARSSGKTVQFDIESATDIHLTGMIYGYGIQPEHTHPTNNKVPWLSGNTSTFEPIPSVL